jgi:ubiquinone/menaquinone biosynthesis C-methylase UbiE
MNRIPEQELMSDSEQARAYAAADFEEPHSAVIRLFQQTFGQQLPGRSVLDLGCGPGDITFRFARAYPDCIVHGVDGSGAMLSLARKALAQALDLRGRVLFIQALLPEIELPLPHYAAVISNSLLHHLPDPQALWESIKCFAGPGAPVCIVDLKRPDSLSEAQRLTDTYARGEPEILQRDFYKSLCAAFEPGELEEQLLAAGLQHFSVTTVSDRHVMITGRMQAPP